MMEVAAEENEGSSLSCQKAQPFAKACIIYNAAGMGDTTIRKTNRRHLRTNYTGH